MTPENKRILKIVGISVGIALVLTAISIGLYKYFHRNDENIETESDEPSQNNYNQSKPQVVNYYNSGFSKDQIEQMQSWLVKIGSLWHNDLIVRAIRDSGGIDGVIGNGFNTALKEAIRVNYVTDIQDLYNKAKSSKI